MTDGFVAHVLASPGVQHALENRLYPMVAPERVKGPYAVYQVITDNRLRVLEGTLNHTILRMQVATWSPNYTNARAAGFAIRDALVDFTGQWTDGTYVYDISCDSFQDAYDSDVRLYGTQADYIIRFSSPTSN